VEGFKNMKHKTLLLILALCSMAASKNAVETDHFMDGGLNPSGDALLYANEGWPGGIQRARTVQWGNILDLPTTAANRLTADMWLNIDTFTNTDELIFWGQNINPTNTRPFEINANGAGETVTVYLISESGTNGGFFARPSGTNHFAILMDRTTGTNCGVTVYTNGVLAPFTQTHFDDMGSSAFACIDLMFLTRGEPERYANAVPGVTLVSFRILYGERPAAALYSRGLPSHPLPRRNWFGEIVP
jgi:hypothetical protein